ncbi:hypothetical protein MPTK1_4g22130 [Marchantia polymorpha subsp. ruderalis]|uniref:Uncharacterized protein n=2 Tax=Marchantia polymorpha TaxID=3197 RepID=A0AAF6BCI5_MARPO|nr:hypothetical protein MARPO_0090s0017 [Marchantia polymorpha]BBN09719.1 hypothetical protein Mp_4g22130 [Marchantia polymorpha subsp. ruderalis]|eukprot:PTQ33271.1 hypothetical protein MARPO_0090s0017 [Marchantia polymorpha]
MAGSMEGVRYLVVACVILALAAAVPQCMSEGQEEVEGKIFARSLHETQVKKERSVDLRKGIHARRSATNRGRFSSQEETSDEISADMPPMFKNPGFVRSHRGVGMRRRTLQSAVAEQKGFVAKAWPAQFTISFTSQSGAVTGYLAYDWINQREVVAYGENAAFCGNFFTDEPCLKLQVPGRTYVYIPSQEKCISGAFGPGSLSPEWTSESTFVGVESVPGVGLCRKFVHLPTSQTWSETVDGSLPCAYGSSETSMTFFHPQTLQVGPPSQELFEFPDYCFAESGSVVASQ